VYLFPLSLTHMHTHALPTRSHELLTHSLTHSLSLSLTHSLSLSQGLAWLVKHYLRTTHEGSAYPADYLMEYLKEICQEKKWPVGTPVAVRALTPVQFKAAWEETLGAVKEDRRVVRACVRCLHVSLTFSCCLFVCVLISLSLSLLHTLTLSLPLSLSFSGGDRRHARRSETRAPALRWQLAPKHCQLGRRRLQPPREHGHSQRQRQRLPPVCPAVHYSYRQLTEPDVEMRL
jgi:hypothetical protein